MSYNIASKLHTSVLISGDPEVVPLHEFTIAGERDLGAIAGCGVTYNVDEGTWTYWSAMHPEQAARMKIVTQAEIDAAADQQEWYGFELGLEEPPPPEGGEGGITRSTPGDPFGIPDVVDDERWNAATARLQRATTDARVAEESRRQAEELRDNTQTERDNAEAALKALDDEMHNSPEAEARNKAHQQASDAERERRERDARAGSQRTPQPSPNPAP